MVLELDAIHFHSSPFTSEHSKEKVMDFANRLSHLVHRFDSMSFLLLKFNKVLHAQIQENVSHGGGQKK